MNILLPQSKFQDMIDFAKTKSKGVLDQTYLIRNVMLLINLGDISMTCICLHNFR